MEAFSIKVKYNEYNSIICFRPVYINIYNHKYEDFKKLLVYFDSTLSFSN